jgi:hypothetical protein
MTSRKCLQARTLQFRIKPRSSRHSYPGTLNGLLLSSRKGPPEAFSAGFARWGQNRVLPGLFIPFAGQRELRKEDQHFLDSHTDPPTGDNSLPPPPHRAHYCLLVPVNGLLAALAPVQPGRAGNVSWQAKRMYPASELLEAGLCRSEGLGSNRGSDQGCTTTLQPQGGRPSRTDTPLPHMRVAPLETRHS